SFTSEDVKDALQDIIRVRGAPAFIRSDNGPEFIARDLGIWLQGQNIGTRFIEPGKPWCSGFAESFHSRLQKECLNLEVFYSVLHAQVVLESWRTLDNTGRPHADCRLFRQQSGTSPDCRLHIRNPFFFFSHPSPYHSSLGYRTPDEWTRETGGRPSPCAGRTRHMRPSSPPPGDKGKTAMYARSWIESLLGSVQALGSG
ncbi:integrase core domain-containing protein, partial [Deinococcus sp. ME38]|uniref:integrase core domain-containing protein n=1 Tax=Deinococcus sp. ME38 TaxID=3400344 RepID=UPI003B5C5C72